MASEERRFRRDYNEYRNEEKDRNRPGDMNYGYTADEEEYNREFYRSTGNRPNRDNDSRFYDSRNLRRDRDRYHIQDYDYNRGNEGTYGRDPGSAEDFRTNRYESGRGYRREREATTGYHGANYETPENSDSSYSRNRDRHSEGRQFQARRTHWGPRDTDRMNQYEIGMGHYNARDRNRTHYGGEKELRDSRNTHSGQGEDRGFMDRNGERVRSWFRNEEDSNRERDRGRSSYDRDRY